MANVVPGPLLLQVAGGADPGDARPDDEHVDVLDPLPSLSCASTVPPALTRRSRPPRSTSDTSSSRPAGRTRVRSGAPGSSRGAVGLESCSAWLSSMLAPYRVLDLTDGRAELATFVLAGLGADVDQGRAAGRVAVAARGARSPTASRTALASLRFHAYNRGKRSVVLDLDDAAGRADFLRLVAERRLRVRERRPRRDGRARARVRGAARTSGPTSSTSPSRRSARPARTPTTWRPT